MGVALYIVLEREISGLDTMMDGKMLSREEEHLTSVARRLGVRPMMDFFSCGAEEASEFLGEEAAEVEIPSEQWFSAEEGLRTVDALLREVDASPELNAARDDLLGCQRVLREAQAHGVRWHLAVDV